jgi:hypothetical protein
VVSDVERSVTVSRRELGVIQSLVEGNQAATVAIREQRIDSQDAFTPFRDGKPRTYVVTLYSPASDEYVAGSPTPMQFLLISGPGLEGTVDVVLLTNRKEPSDV